jgi:hypothetical protein
MKKASSIITLFTVLLFAILSMAHNKVVVVPLISCPDNQPINKIVFVSSETYTGNLGGISGANDKCDQLAQNAGLTGSYKAWISNSKSTPATTFNRSKGPYVLVDQTIVANNWNDLTDSILNKSINLTESGALVNALSKAWTNTHPDGSIISLTTTESCSDFTSVDAQYTAVTGTIVLYYSSEWTRHNSTSCQESHYIYCIQQ